ncbi:NADH-quinone oxidoreductase subunit C [Arenicellales bacterium IMCC57338]
MSTAISGQKRAAFDAVALKFEATVEEKFGEFTLIAPAHNVIALLTSLRDHRDFLFEQLVDLCGVDFDQDARRSEQHPERFAVVYHLLSVSKNTRVRVVVYLPEVQPIVRTVVGLWASANWFEREAFDLFGILFEGHPDLRRLLTDYGFVGHPFRKDFPLSGHVEMRYDEEKGRVIYEPVSIEPRVTVPRVVR